MENTLIEKAELFAKRKHAEVNQVRKYTGDPYISHPRAVVRLVSRVTDDPQIISAAWLHDTVEDTNTKIQEIESEFGVKIASFVDMLTDVSNPEDGNRAVRKEIDRVHLSKAHPDAKTVKLADLIHNSISIIEHDPKFARVYMKEKELLLEVLKEGDVYLYEIAMEMIGIYKSSAL